MKLPSSIPLSWNIKKKRLITLIIFVLACFDGLVGSEIFVNESLDDGGVDGSSKCKLSLDLLSTRQSKYSLPLGYYCRFNVSMANFLLQ